MNGIKEIYNRIYTPVVSEIGRIFFYMALFFEVIIFLLDRSDWYNPYQSMMFRITFALFLVKCICTKYEKREWIFIICCAVFSFIAYRFSLKDEVIRATVLVIAMKDLDERRVLKFNYFVTLSGIVILALLAVFGIMGEVWTVGGYLEKAEMNLLCLGLGSPNTFAIQIWLFIAIIEFIYHKRLDGRFYGLSVLIGLAVFILTRCRIASGMIFITAILGYLFFRFPGLAGKLWIYITGIFITLACVGFSVYAAAVSKWWEQQTKWELFLNRLTTGRIASIYPFENGGGVLKNWRLFGAPDFDRIFDMGIVRMFWWYGIIPGSLAVMAVIILFIRQYKKKDIHGFLLTISMVIFTVLEAHFVSVFLARAWILFLFGGAWVPILKELTAKCTGESATEKKHIAFYIGSLNKGGAERVFVNLAEYFLSAGYDVTMITQYVRDDEYELPEGADRVISDLSPEECRGRIYNFFVRILKLHRCIRDTNADLLMTTIGKANFMAITCSTFLKTKVVVSVVADPPLEYPSRIMRFLLQTLFGEADGIIMQTGRQLEFLRKGLQREAVILPNSVSPRFIRDKFTGERKKEIYTVGRMDENKHQSLAISAFASATDVMSEYKLVLCGDGPEKDNLMKLADSLNVSDRTEFAGTVSDVPDRLYDAYAFLLTSDTEGMPNTLLEAMSLGLPCISTDCPCGGPAEIIRDRENGILIPVGDESSLSEAIRQLISDPEFAENLGDRAYETMKDYRPDKVNARWQSYFDEIIGL